MEFFESTSMPRLRDTLDAQEANYEALVGVVLRDAIYFTRSRFGLGNEQLYCCRTTINVEENVDGKEIALKRIPDYSVIYQQNKEFHKVYVMTVEVKKYKAYQAPVLRKSDGKVYYEDYRTQVTEQQLLAKIANMNAGVGTKNQLDQISCDLSQLPVFGIHTCFYKSEYFDQLEPWHEIGFKDEDDFKRVRSSKANVEFNESLWFIHNKEEPECKLCSNILSRLFHNLKMLTGKQISYEDFMGQNPPHKQNLMLMMDEEFKKLSTRVSTDGQTNKRNM